MTNNAQALRDKMDRMLDAKSTEAIVSVMVKADELYKAETDRDEKIALNETQRSAYRVIEARHPEIEPHMEAFFSDESEAGIEFMCSHTYTELLMLALDQAGII